MKHLKTYESILVKQYHIIKNIGTDEIELVSIKYSEQYDNRYLAEDIISQERFSKSFYILSDEIAENTYQTTNPKHDQIEILYITKDLEDAKRNYEIYTNANKYNL